MKINLEWVRYSPESPRKAEGGNIYLIPFCIHEGGRARCVTKIGKGSTDRVNRVIQDARKVNVEPAGSVFMCTVPDAFMAEKLLHERFYRRRVSQVDMIGFNGATELFDLSIKTIKQVKSLEYQNCDPFVRSPQVLSRKLAGEWVRDGLMICALHEKLSPSAFESGDIRLCLHRTGYRRPVSSNSLHAIKIDWFTFVGMLPLELWGNPVKDSPEWRSAIAELSQFQSQMTAFLDQWSLTNLGYEEVLARMTTNGSISLVELAEILALPSLAVQVGDSEWQHQRLLRLINSR